MPASSPRITPSTDKSVQLGLVSLAAVCTFASAHPHEQKRWAEGDPGCMTWDQAQAVVDNWKELITAYSDEAADRSVTTGFTDYSESVNTLINTCPQGDSAKAQTVPLLAPTFTTREEFKQGQGEQPPINFEQLQMWHTCSSVTARWKTTNTAPLEFEPKPVIGIFVLETVPVDGAFKIDRAYSEFDAGAWLQNLQDWGICGPSEDAVMDYETASGVAPAPAAATPIPAVPTTTHAAGTTLAPAIDDMAYGNTTSWAA